MHPIAAFQQAVGEKIQEAQKELVRLASFLPSPPTPLPPPHPRHHLPSLAFGSITSSYFAPRRRAIITHLAEAGSGDKPPSNGSFFSNLFGGPPPPPTTPTPTTSTPPTTTTPTPTTTPSVSSRITLPRPKDDPTRKLSKEEEQLLESESVLVSDISITGVEGPLRTLLESTLTTKPNLPYTVKDISSQAQRLLNTGFLKRVDLDAEDTRDGVRITLRCQPNPPLSRVKVIGTSVLPPDLAESYFRPYYNKTLNQSTFLDAVRRLNEWYRERGYYGQVADINTDALESNGTVTVRMVEAIVDKIALKFQKVGEPDSLSDKGRTRSEVILRHLSVKPGQVFNERIAKRDIESVYSMGLYEDVSLEPSTQYQEGQSGAKVNLTLKVVERKTGGLSMGGGISSSSYAEGGTPGFIGNVAYSERNLFGMNQKLTLSAEIGQNEVLYRIHHFDPWVGKRSVRTSRAVTVMNTKSSLNAIHSRVVEGRREGREAIRGDLYSSRELGSVEWSRPLGGGRREGGGGEDSGGGGGGGGTSGGAMQQQLLSSSGSWNASWGLTVQRTKILDERGAPLLLDHYNLPVTFSGKKEDWAVMGHARAAYTGAEGESLMVSVEKTIPPPPLSPTMQALNFFRVRARGEHKVRFGRGGALLLSARGGTVWGDLPPYEAFSIGGTNSVRGYDEGAVGTGRHCAVVTSEIHWPLVGQVTGTVFADVGSDLGSGRWVAGDPAGARGKPGTGYGMGAGVRVDSPVGPLRLEYAVNDKRRGRFHFGVGAQI